MIDIDFGPGVVLGIIIAVFLLPTLYGVFLVDKFWKGHRDHASAAESEAEDAFR